MSFTSEKVHLKRLEDLKLSSEARLMKLNGELRKPRDNSLGEFTSLISNQLLISRLIELEENNIINLDHEIHQARIF